MHCALCVLQRHRRQYVTIARSKYDKKINMQRNTTPTRRISIPDWRAAVILVIDETFICGSAVDSRCVSNSANSVCTFVNAREWLRAVRHCIGRIYTIHIVCFRCSIRWKQVRTANVFATTTPSSFYSAYRNTSICWERYVQLCSTVCGGWCIFGRTCDAYDCRSPLVR